MGWWVWWTGRTGLDGHVLQTRGSGGGYLAPEVLHSIPEDPAARWIDVRAI